MHWCPEDPDVVGSLQLSLRLYLFFLLPGLTWQAPRGTLGLEAPRLAFLGSKPDVIVSSGTGD